MNKTILFCDDEPHIIRAAEFKFKRSGYTVLCGNDGQEGWELLQQHPVDILVTDCQMPRMDGLQLAQRVRTNPATAKLPVILLTAKGFELTREETRETLGVLAVLAKPFSPRELFRIVEEVLETGDFQPATSGGPVL